MTRKQILRRYDRLIRDCFRDMAGGLSYGMDWPTLRAVFPDRYAEIVELRKLYREAN